MRWEDIVMVFDISSCLGVSFYLLIGLRIIIAAACGAAIGYERKKNFKAAGLRTHILICCGAALFMILSKYAFVDLAGPSAGALYATSTTDPARIAAQVVTGIGFLGAGAIFKNGATVKGLTTAAGIWMTAGIGMAIGSGMLLIGVFSTVFILAVQLLIRKQSVHAASNSTLITMTIHSESASEIVQSFLANEKGEVSSRKITRLPDQVVEHVVTITLLGVPSHEKLAQFLKDHPEVLSISVVK